MSDLFAIKSVKIADKNLFISIEQQYNVAVVVVVVDIYISLWLYIFFCNCVHKQFVAVTYGTCTLGHCYMMAKNNLEIFFFFCFSFEAHACRKPTNFCRLKFVGVVTENKEDNYGFFCFIFKGHKRTESIWSLLYLIFTNLIVSK